VSKSALLRLSDVRSLYLLAGECHDLGDDPNEWRRHFSAKLAHLVGADLVFAGELRGMQGGRPGDIGNVAWGLDTGFNVAGWLRALEYLSYDPAYSIMMNNYIEHFRAADGVARRRTDLMPDSKWYESLDFQEVYRTVGGDQTIFCFRSIPEAPDEVNGAVLTRGLKRRDFSLRDREVVQEGLSIIAPLVGGALARYSEPSPGDLSLRARQVLRCLLEGDGDKQIAKRLRISPHTVNEYTKTIYRHFGVKGRVELMARWIRRRWGSRCVWADE